MCGEKTAKPHLAVNQGLKEMAEDAAGDDGLAELQLLHCRLLVLDL
jgi:hypothetical protein